MFKELLKFWKITYQSELHKIQKLSVFENSRQIRKFDEDKCLLAAKKYVSNNF